MIEPQVPLWRRTSDLALAGGAWLWIYVTAFAVSYLPRVSLRSGELTWSESALAGVSLTERVREIFYRWDSIKYADIALNGHRPDTDTLAFFPGWPYLLSLLPTTDPRTLVLGATLLNFGFLFLAVYFWRRIFRELGQESHLIYLLLYPTAVFFVAPYPEAAYLALGGGAMWLMLRERWWAFGAMCVAFMLTKHAALPVAGAFVAGAFLWRRRGFPAALIAWILGATWIFAYYRWVAGDPLAWLKAQAAWNRKIDHPLALFADLHGKSADLGFYLLWLFASPLMLARRWFWKAAPVAQKLCFARRLSYLYLVFLFFPLWLGSSTQSLYRIIVLGTPALLILPTPERLSRRNWRVLLGVMIVLNIYATYRFATGLYLP